MSYEIDIKIENVELRQFIDFVRETKYIIDGISDNIVRSPKLYSKKETIYPLFLEHLNSVVGSLESIELCALHKHMADAGTLVRKVRDDLLQFLRLYDTLTKLDKEFFSKLVASEDIIQTLLNTIEQQKCNYINTWLEDSASENDINRLKNYLKFSCYSKYLFSVPEISRMLSTVYGDADKFREKIWDPISYKLNDIVHLNSKKYLMANWDVRFSVELYGYLKQIMIFFVSFLMMIDSSLFRSSDYIDYLENNMQPDENWLSMIMPIVQNFVTETIGTYDTKLKEYIVKCNVSGMTIE